jgi:hypothetical protein
VKGWLCRRGTVAPDGERRLLAAIVLQAVIDAQRGRPGAMEWLESTGRAWCELLGIPVDDWTTAAGNLPAARRELSAWLAQRWKDDDWRNERKTQRQNRA